MIAKILSLENFPIYCIFFFLYRYIYTPVLECTVCYLLQRVLLTLTVGATVCHHVSLFQTQEQQGHGCYLTVCAKSNFNMPSEFVCSHFVIQRDNGYIAHTAFGLLSLKQYVETFESDEGSASTLVSTDNYVFVVSLLFICSVQYAQLKDVYYHSIESAPYTEDCQDCHIQSRAIFAKAIPKQEKFLQLCSCPCHLQSTAKQ